ncbi:NAD(P)H-dependent oxidoreductase [Candidatus Pacearchaeota archaeon]|nr:NAD(P)H-dependent oxidoreductase [Candidatus Pacearchaeota archaeon]
MAKKILVIMGHPSKNSFSRALADYYIEGAGKNFEVKSIFLSDIKFNPILIDGYSEKQKLEPDLIDAQEKIKWAEHILIIYPIWWTAPPAILKGFIERVFLPGFAFRYEKGGKVNKLLNGKTASLIMTTGGRRLWYFLFGWIMNKPMSIGTLGFCGIKTKKQLFISEVRKVEYERANRIFRNLRRLGEKGF